MKKIITTKEEIIECESCGNILRSSNPKIKDYDYWENTNGIVMCNDCIAVPLDVLRDVYIFLKKNQVNPAIEKIKEFVEDGFTNIKLLEKGLLLAFRRVQSVTIQPDLHAGVVP